MATFHLTRPFSGFIETSFTSIIVVSVNRSERASAIAPSRHTAAELNSRPRGLTRILTGPVTMATNELPPHQPIRCRSHRSAIPLHISLSSLSLPLYPHHGFPSFYLSNPDLPSFPFHLHTSIHDPFPPFLSLNVSSSYSLLLLPSITLLFDPCHITSHISLPLSVLTTTYL